MFFDDGCAQYTKQSDIRVIAHQCKYMPDMQVSSVDVTVSFKLSMRIIKVDKKIGCLTNF